MSDEATSEGTVLFQGDRYNAVDDNDDDNETEEPEAEPQVESWVKIQQHTFTNWVNDKLQMHLLEVKNLWTDLKDGIKLCRLIETLRGQKIGRIAIKKKLNHYEASGNLQLAFDALAQDRVRLVNIGAEDVRSGNIKLILGLVWTLIRRYQIGSQSKLPPKAMMLSWCNAVLHPYCTVHNFSTDWSDGIALHGLIEYCRPGTCPHWHQMAAVDRVGNCMNAMRLANELFDIPTVIRPEDMASPDVDELSGMTYLSYFMAEDSPGYKATLNWVRIQISPHLANNFQTDWNNGVILSHLVKSLGGNVHGWPSIQTDSEIANQIAIDAARTQLDIEPVLSSRDLANPDVDHIGVMAHAAWHEASTRGQMGAIIEEPEPSIIEEPEPEVIEVEAPPSSRPDVTVTVRADWRIDRVMTFDIDTSSLGIGSVTSYAEAPSGTRNDLAIFPVSDENLYNAEFLPTEKGDWSIYVTYNGEEVESCPHHVNVYDPSGARINRDYGMVTQNDAYTFEVDTSHVGLDDVSVYVVHEGASINHDVTPNGDGKYQVSFVPVEKGSFTVAVFSGGMEIPGSPFDVVCKIVEGIYARGIGLTDVSPHGPAQFEVDTTTAPGRPLLVSITGPSGYGVDCDVTGAEQGVHTVTYTPEGPGVHTIEVLYDGVHIASSPYTVHVKKPRVYIRDLSVYAQVGQRSLFKIDASEMQKGTLEIDSDLPVISTEKLGQNTYMVAFIPKTIGHHDLVIKYNNEEVEGSPFDVAVKPPSSRRY